MAFAHRRAGAGRSRDTVREIVIGARTQFITQVSGCDYDFLMQWLWTYARSHGRGSGLIYARRCVTIDGAKLTLLMHRIILVERMGLEPPSDCHTTDHRNGRSLDNQRRNLRWLTPEQQMRNQHGILSMPIQLLPAQEIPF